VIETAPSESVELADEDAKNTMRKMLAQVSPRAITG
jgi:hypothetical protein